MFPACAVSPSSKVLYTGQAYIDQANTQSVPAWTRWILGARYPSSWGPTPAGLLAAPATSEPCRQNNYWVAASGFMNEALPRTFLLSLTADF